jgi:hypothetical protein
VDRGDKVTQQLLEFPLLLSFFSPFPGISEIPSTLMLLGMQAACVQNGSQQQKQKLGETFEGRLMAFEHCRNSA